MPRPDASEERRGPDVGWLNHDAATFAADDNLLPLVWKLTVSREADGLAAAVAEERGAKRHRPRVRPGAVPGQRPA
jgi:hypothetical protein